MGRSGGKQKATKASKKSRSSIKEDAPTDISEDKTLTMSKFDREQTGQPIPDEAIKAGELGMDLIYDATDSQVVEGILTAALPHLETVIRTDALSKVREQIEAERLEEVSAPLMG